MNSALCRRDHSSAGQFSSVFRHSVVPERPPRPTFSLKRTQVGRGRDTVGERQQREHLSAVLGDAAIADLAIAKLAFDDTEHVLD